MLFVQYRFRVIFALLTLSFPQLLCAKNPILAVEAQLVTADAGSPVTLVIRGRTAAGSLVERKQELSSEFYVEGQSFSSGPLRAGADASSAEVYRILYKPQGKEYIVGYMQPGASDGQSAYAELTNVPWGFDLKSQSFWYEATPARLPYVPVEFGNGNWYAARFRMPLEFERFRPEEVRAIVKARSGVMVGPGQIAQVVLLPDDVDFISTRHREAELLIRKGAFVLWERNFPRAPALAD